MALMERSRRILFVILSVGLLATSSSAPMGESSRRQARRKSLVSSPKNSEEIGNPEDLAWKAWILVDQGDSNIGGGLDSAKLLRKITPKSIFIAPSLEELPDCAEGYEADAMNRCVKNVNINREAHIDFLIQRLNAMYANFGAPKPEAANSGSAPTGPLQLNLLNIPVVVEHEDQEEKEDVETRTTISPALGEETDKRLTAENPPVVVDDKIEEEDDEESDRKPFFHEPQTTKDGSENDESNSGKYDGIVPVIDFVDDTNSSYSEVIDYKVDADDKLHNHTIAEGASMLEVKGDDAGGRRPFNDSSLAPTVVLLLTPTKLPILKGDLIVAHNSSTGMLSVRRDKGNGTETEEIIGVNLPEHLATASAPIEILNGSVPDNLEFELSTTEETATEESETETPGEDEVSDVEESTEGEDEILAHSEAGMMVTMQPRIQPSSTPVDDDRDTTVGKISSSITINDDFVRETIVVGLNLGQDQDPGSTNFSESEDKTLSPFPEDEIITVTPQMFSDQETTLLEEETPFTEVPGHEETTEDDITDWREPTTPEQVTNPPELPATTKVFPPVIRIEKHSQENTSEKPATKLSSATSRSPEESDSSEIMTVSSSNNAEAIFRRQPAKNTRYSTSIKQNRNPLAGIKYVTAMASDSPDIYTEIKTIDDQLELQKVPDADRFFPDHRKLDSDSPTKDFVFPNDNKIRNRPGYIRFPSEEANSIHTPDDFKDRRHHRPFNQGPTAIKTPPNPQKQIHWPYWRNDHQGSSRTRTGVTEKLKERSPIWFWAKMPFVRDPSLLRYQTNSDSFNRSDDRFHGTRRVNFYKEISSHDVPRAFARSSIGG